MNAVMLTAKYQNHIRTCYPTFAHLKKETDSVPELCVLPFIVEDKVQGPNNNKHRDQTLSYV